MPFFGIYGLEFTYLTDTAEHVTVAKTKILKHLQGNLIGKLLEE